MIRGAREGVRSVLRRLIARAQAHLLAAVVVPGPEVAAACGLDLAAAGVVPASSPRHAGLLVVVGAVPAELRETAAAIYAGMMRPRAVLALGSEELRPLPEADVAAELSQPALLDAMRRLRRLVADGAFGSDVTDFDAPVLRGRTEYVCPMHPEVVRDEPGACPKCGMTLVSREAGSEGAPREAEAGSGADRPAAAQVAMNHGAVSHSADQSPFMSMVAVTRDLPRSPDGLPMDWIEVPFGPLFPGLPGGLSVRFTLDGDAVVNAAVRSLVALGGATLAESEVPAAKFARRLGGSDPLAPVAYRLLARRALERAAGIEADMQTARAQAGAVERERLASHLAWLAAFLNRLGLGVRARRSWALAAALRGADPGCIAGLAREVYTLVRRVKDTPLLRRRLAGIGRLREDNGLRGPLARAAGGDGDARAGEAVYGALGFEPVKRRDGDALARLEVRLGEIQQSLRLVLAAGAVDDAGAPDLGSVSGTGKAVIETARGAASLSVSVEHGRMRTAQLDTPSTLHLERIGSLVAQCELGDALTAVASLDLSPWDIVQ